MAVMLSVLALRRRLRKWQGKARETGKGKRAKERGGNERGREDTSDEGGGSNEWGHDERRRPQRRKRRRQEKSMVAHAKMGTSGMRSR
eukprot:1562421-Pleurochrysis_carterae.AAC.4